MNDNTVPWRPFVCGCYSSSIVEWNWNVIDLPLYICWMFYVNICWMALMLSGCCVSRVWVLHYYRAKSAVSTGVNCPKQTMRVQHCPPFTTLGSSTVLLALFDGTINRCNAEQMDGLVDWFVLLMGKGSLNYLIDRLITWLTDCLIYSPIRSFMRRLITVLATVSSPYHSRQFFRSWYY